MWCKYVVAIGAVIILIVNLIVFPGFLRMFGLSGGMVLDVMFHFTVGDVLKVLTDMNSGGRMAFVVGHMLIDTPYAFIYAFTYACVLSLLGADRKFLILPFMVAASDVAENVSLSAAAVTFPKVNPWAYWSSIFVTLKWVGVFLLIVAFLYLLVDRFILKRLKEG